MCGFAGRSLRMHIAAREATSVHGTPLLRPDGKTSSLDLGIDRHGPHSHSPIVSRAKSKYRSFDFLTAGLMSDRAHSPSG